MKPLTGSSMQTNGAERLVLVKHAMPTIAPSTPPRGWSLGEQGKAQSRLLAARLRVFAPLRLVASPEPKALETGQIVARELDLPISSAEGLQELDRPAVPIMTRAEREQANQPIFTDLDRSVGGTECARTALARFTAAINILWAGTKGQSLVVITHGTVISLLVGAHNGIDAFDLWRRLACPSIVVLEPRSFKLVAIIEDALGSSA